MLRRVCALRPELGGRHRLLAHAARAALWIKGEMRRLGTLGGKTSAAIAVNNRGQIVGARHLPEEPGSTRSCGRDGRMDLATVRGLVGEASAINDRGQVIGSVDNQGRNARV